MPFSLEHKQRSYIVNKYIWFDGLIRPSNVDKTNCVLSVWGEHNYFFILKFCLNSVVIERYGREPSAVQRWTSNSLLSKVCQFKFLGGLKTRKMQIIEFSILVFFGPRKRKSVQTFHGTFPKQSRLVTKFGCERIAIFWGNKSLRLAQPIPAKSGPMHPGLGV